MFNGFILGMTSCFLSDHKSGTSHPTKNQLSVPMLQPVMLENLRL